MKPTTLFASIEPADEADQLDQFFTPAWLAEAIVERYFPALNSADHVLEPSCGSGRILQAIPANVPATGIEIDPQLAQLARANTGRQVIEGDYRTVALDFQPTAIIGNPPFDVSKIEALMKRAHGWLPEGGQMGLILPAYMFQTAARVAGYAEQWSIRQDIIPRNVFPGLSKPLVFAVFSKDAARTLIGFAFFHEAARVQQLPTLFRELFAQAAGPLWRRVVTAALECLGGEASLEAIYSLVEGNRPTLTPHWREKIRQVCRSDFQRIDRGRYALPRAA